MDAFNNGTKVIADSAIKLLNDLVVYCESQRHEIDFHNTVSEALEEFLSKYGYILEFSDSGTWSYRKERR